MSINPLSKDRVVETLRKRILSGELASDTPLREEKLAEEFGVSRTPIREALRQLVSERLIRIIPNSGAFVGSISWNDAREIFEIRKILEAYSAMLSSSRLTPKYIEELEILLEEQESAAKKSKVDEFIRCDMKFHSILNENSGNAHLMELINRLNDQGKLHMLRRRSFEKPGSLEISLREHREIFAAIKTYDPAKVSSVVLEHGNRFFNGIENIEESLFISISKAEKGN